MYQKLFVTCPIFYVNAKPHLGHAYTLFLSDAWTRYGRLRGHPSLVPFPSSNLTKRSSKSTTKPASFLSTGTDEHGMKVNQAAMKFAKFPQDYCDEVSPLFKSLCEQNSVAFSDFIRTTESRHESAVKEFWRRLDQGGHLYQNTYSGWYSVSDETFYSDWELRPADCNSGSERSPTRLLVAMDTGSPVEWIQETNTMFRLSSFKEALHKWLDSGVFLSDSPSQTICLTKAHQLVETARDVSVSRPRNRLDWGIGVPDQPDQVVYVWLDALVNYLTVAGFPRFEDGPLNGNLWPPDFQLFGRDILRFHAVLWPALLMAADLPLPQHLVCHYHLLADGNKMSKSKGNVLDPVVERMALTPEVEHLTAADSDGFRFALLRLSLLTNDATYSPSAAKQMVNTDLVNCLGNLLSRVTSKRLNPNQSIVHISRQEAGVLFGQQEEDLKLLESMDSLAIRFDKLWWFSAQPHLAIDLVFQTLRQTNSFIDRHKPWMKAPSTEPEFVIAVAAESLRLAGLLLRPVIPNLSSRLLHRLGIEGEDETANHKPTPLEKYFWLLGPNQGPFLHRLGA